MLENLEKYHILLASKSPRRRELLSDLRIPFSPISLGGIDESYPEDMPKTEVPQYIANKKADAYLENISGNEMIITADTLVIKDEKVYGKPKNCSEAVQMLKELSGAALPSAYSLLIDELLSLQKQRSNLQNYLKKT